MTKISAKMKKLEDKQTKSLLKLDKKFNDLSTKALNGKELSSLDISILDDYFYDLTRDSKNIITLEKEEKKAAKRNAKIKMGK